MSVVKIIRELFTIGFGIIGIGVGLSEPDFWYGTILGVGLVAWGSWDIYKELRDASSGSEVSQMGSEREALKRRLEEEETD